MKVEPKIINNVCLTTHPKGCEKMVESHIEWIQGQAPLKMPKRILIIGASTGFGLAARISAAFGGGADTIGVFFEKEPTEKRTGTPGWYNSIAFEKRAKALGLKAESINGDAFSNEAKEETIARIKETCGQVDAVIYSLASPVRKDPETGELYKSTLKPIGKSYSEKSIDFMTDSIKDATFSPATDAEIASTVKVMGGEDWKLWIEALKNEGALADGATTVAFSYIGPEVTYPVYWEGTIGEAKKDLEIKVKEIQRTLDALGGKAYISVNKALVTRASAVIPVVPLYIAILFKIMKNKELHEDTLEQMYRMFSEKLYAEDGSVPMDSQGRIRLDDWEMRNDVQSEVSELWGKVNESNVREITDIASYKRCYLQLHGFDVPGIDYTEEVDP